MSAINKFFVLPLSIYLINSFSIYCQNTNKYSVGLSIGTHDGIKNTGDGTTKIYQFHHYINPTGKY